MNEPSDKQTTPAMGLLLGILLGPIIAVPISALVILMVYTSMNYCEIAFAPPPAFAWWQWPWGWPGVRLAELFVGAPRLWCSSFDLFENLLRGAVATAINVTVASLPLLAPLWVFLATSQKGWKT